MNAFQALRISASGMTAQRLRMDVIASNLANINSTRTAEGGPYQKKDIIFAAQPLSQTFHQVLQSCNPGLSEVKVVGIRNDPRPPLLRYDPEHPDANEDGYVAMPNINLMEEMVNMISATRSYEAGVAAVNATRDMALKALEIGR